jgi:hypothetical protein
MSHRRNSRTTFAAAALLALAALAGGCGSGGGTAADSGAGPAPVTEAIAWAPPTSFFDNTPLNPQTDLAYYEIYIGPSPVFTDNDAPVAAVAAVTVETGSDGKSVAKATSSFNLTNIAPLVEHGKPCFVSVRAVGIDNLVSSFSPPVQWDLG